VAAHRSSSGARAIDGGGGTSRWKVPRVIRTRAVLTDGVGGGSGPARPNSGCRGRKSGATGGAQLVSLPGSCWVDNARTCPARDTELPTGKVGWLVAGDPPSSGLLPRVGVAVRSPDVGVGFGGSKLGRRLEGKPAKDQVGQKGESLKLGNREILRMLVTTSRLQRLDRGIFSPNSARVSARAGCWE